MAQQRYTHYQSLDPFAALGTYHVQRVEQAVHEHLTALAWHAEPRWTVSSVARDVSAWLRHRGLASRRIPRRHPV